MYIPKSIRQNVKEVKRISLTDGGKVLTDNGYSYKVLEVNAAGVVVETIENETIVDKLYYWDEIE